MENSDFGALTLKREHKSAIIYIYVLVITVIDV